MKKMGFLLALLLIVLTGCSNGNVIKMDEYTWLMTSVQSVEEEGQTIACGLGGSSVLDTAVQIDLACKAENGVITLKDRTNNKTYTGSYKLTDIDSRSSVYEITLGSSNGMAVVAMTTFQDESQTPTCIINLGDYVLNFSSK